MPDPYANPDAHSEVAIQAMITRLEQRGRHAQFHQMIRNYVETLATDRPITLLDLGCGTGVVTRELATRVHPASSIHGADVSFALLEKARSLPSGARIHWDHVTPGPLPYPDETFDVITMHTLLSHVPDPDTLLRDARRVLKQDGELIIFDADHASTTYAQPTYAQTRRFDHLLISAIATYPDICRQLPRLLKGAGFTVTHHHADIISECGRGDYWLSSVQGLAKLLPTLGSLTPAEADSWTQHMLQSHEDGTFFAAGAFYTFYTRRTAEISKR